VKTAPVPATRRISVKEHKVVWLIAAAALLGLGVFRLIDGGSVVLGAVLVVAGGLFAAAGLSGRDYMGRKPGSRSSSG
jgi:hypothetical protein